VEVNLAAAFTVAVVEVQLNCSGGGFTVNVIGAV
jgi:hypothetical protein